MRSENEILDTWAINKRQSASYRLMSETNVAYEYRGVQFGHPSNYAGVQLNAVPSSTFILEWRATCPSSVTDLYARDLLFAAERAAVDELFAVDWYTYRGCRITVSELAWDEIMSSEVALYRAVRGALAKLRSDGQWELQHAAG